MPQILAVLVLGVTYLAMNGKGLKRRPLLALFVNDIDQCLDW
jgi:hypothetical protein